MACLFFTAMALATSTRADIDRRRRIDADRGCNLGLLAPRIRSIADAQRALAAREEGAGPALRQSLVDLAACAEAVAADLPDPTP